MNNKPKVLIVSNDSSKTGAPTQILMLLKGLKEKFDFEVCCPDGWLKNEAELLRLKTHLWPDGRLSVQLKTMAALYDSVMPDIIHCHGIRPGIVGRLCNRPKKTKLVYTEHLWTNDFHLKSPVLEFIQHQLLIQGAKRSDWVVAVSQAVEDFLINKRRVDPKIVNVIYGAITPMTKVKPKNYRTIGTLGRLTYVKGIPTIIKATAILRQKFPNIKCIIGGDGPKKAEYMQLVNSLGVSDNIEWVCEVTDVDSFYQKLTVYVQPSLSESFGIATGEAMSAGLPVVASRVGGLPELIGRSGAGLFFPAKNAQILASNIESIISDKDKYKKMSDAAIERSKIFSLKTYLDSYSQLYEKLINK